MSLLLNLYNLPFIKMLLHADEANLKKLVNKSWSVLDLGCGSNPPILRVMEPDRYLGIDAFENSIIDARNTASAKGLKNCSFEVMDLLNLNFADRQFDVVLCIDVIEHLHKEDGVKLLKNAKSWAAKALYVSTPNGYLRQDPYDSNQYQEHLSGWLATDFHEMGFGKVIGGGGLKFLRKSEMQPDEWQHVSGSSMKWKPVFFWSFIANALQVFTYKLPRSSYQLHAFFMKAE
jgi:SAM-dependent methyltransferase